MTDADRHPPTRIDDPPATDNAPPTDYTVAVSPRQLAGGFAIIAAIVVLLVRSRRRRGQKRDSD